MMREISPEAYLDALIILNDSPKSTIQMTVIEMHLLSYLGCILALFQGSPIGDWGYSYAITTEGFPFSAELECARNNLELRGLVSLSNEGLLQTTQPNGSQELSFILNSGSWDKRRAWIKAATECTLAIPLGLIRYAIGNSPGMATPNRLGQNKKLLDSYDVESLYDEYKIVNEVLGKDAKDLLSPTVIWLSARILQNKDEQVYA
jgi:hypothetical protein